MTIAEAAAQLRSRSVSCLELAEAALAAVEHENPRLNVFLTVTGDTALARARELDAELARGIDRGALHGIPIAHKDIVDTAGVRTTMGTKVFTDRVAERDAEVVTRMAEAGCVTIGKTNLHEICYGITSNNPHFGPVRNPWDLTCIPGGSSGGSAAAVATGVVFLATGTDTGGSIRIPAAMCGVVGFKPTYDRVSRKGVGPLGFTLDHLGPIARTVVDAATFLDFRAETVDLKRARIGIPKTFFFDRVDRDVARVVRDAVRGRELIEVDVPDIEAVNAVGRLILIAETATVWRRYPRQDFGEDVRAGIEQGLKVSAADYLDAQRLRRVLSEEFARVWDKVDFLVTPTTPTTAPKIGATSVVIDAVEEDVRMASTRLARPFNVMGWPALSMPCGLSSAGMPVGLQLVAPAHQDDRLLGAGVALERELDFKGLRT